MANKVFYKTKWMCSKRSEHFKNENFSIYFKCVVVTNTEGFTLAAAAKLINLILKPTQSGQVPDKAVKQELTLTCTSIRQRTRDVPPCRLCTPQFGWEVSRYVSYQSKHQTTQLAWSVMRKKEKPARWLRKRPKSEYFLRYKNTW